MHLVVYILVSVIFLSFLLFFCLILQKSLFLGVINHNSCNVVVNDMKLLDTFCCLFDCIYDDREKFINDTSNKHFLYKCSPYVKEKYLFYFIKGQNKFLLNNNLTASDSGRTLLFNKTGNLFFNESNFFIFNNVNYNIICSYECFIKSSVLYLLGFILENNDIFLSGSFFLEKQDKDILQIIKNNPLVSILKNKRLVFISLLPNNFYTLQFASASQASTLYEYAKRNKLSNYLVYKTIRNNRHWYILVDGVYLTKFQANLAIDGFFTQKMFHHNYEKPWIRSIKSIKLDLYD